MERDPKSWRDVQVLGLPGDDERGAVHEPLGAQIDPAGAADWPEDRDESPAPRARAATFRKYFRKWLGKCWPWVRVAFRRGREGTEGVRCLARWGGDPPTPALPPADDTVTTTVTLLAGYRLADEHTPRNENPAGDLGDLAVALAPETRLARDDLSRFLSGADGSRFSGSRSAASRRLAKTLAAVYERAGAVPFVFLARQRKVAERPPAQPTRELSEAFAEQLRDRWAGLARVAMRATGDADRAEEWLADWLAEAAERPASFVDQPERYWLAALRNYCRKRAKALPPPALGLADPRCRKKLGEEESPAVQKRPAWYLTTMARRKLR